MVDEGQIIFRASIRHFVIVAVDLNLRCVGLTFQFVLKFSMDNIFAVDVVVNHF